MPRLRRSGRKALWIAALVASVALVWARTSVLAQQAPDAMERTGIVGIQNDLERQLFYSLICTCGCPRETLGTCTCGWAHQRRDELRAQLTAGKSMEQIQNAYVAQYGTAALAVPRAEGAAQLLYLAPLAAIALGALFAIRTLKRWQSHGAEVAAAARARAGGKDGASTGEGGAAAPRQRDAYDDKLDDELKDLD